MLENCNRFWSTSTGAGTYFSSGGGGISMAEGVPGGVFSFSIIANGASGSGLTEFVSIRRHPILALI